MTEACLALLPLPTPTTDDPRSQVRARPRKHAALTILYPRSPSSALRTSAKPAGLKTVACPAQSGAKPARLKTVACPAQSGAHCNQPSVPASHRHAQPRTTGSLPNTEALLKEAERAAASSNSSSEQQQQQREAAAASSSSSEQQQRAEATAGSEQQQQGAAAAASSSSDRSSSSELYIPTRTSVRAYLKYIPACSTSIPAIQYKLVIKTPLKTKTRPPAHK